MSVNFPGTPFRYNFPGTPTPVGASSTAEAVIAELEIPDLDTGDRIHFAGSAVSTGANSTDTHQIAVRLGSLTGPVVAKTPATDVAAGDIARFSGDLKVKLAGIAGVAQVAGAGSGQYSTSGSSPAVAGNDGTVSAQYAATKTAPLKLVVTGKMGASNAANVATLIDLHALVYKRT